MTEKSPYLEIPNALHFNNQVEVDVAKQVIYGEVIQRLEEEIAISNDPSFKVCDIGSGSGHFVQKLSEKLPSVSVIYADLSPANIELTKSKLDPTEQNASGFVFNLENGIPLQKSSVNAITSHFVLSEVKNLSLVLKEFNRILKPNGLYIITMTSSFSDELTSQLRPHKIEGVDFSSNTNEQKGTYTLGKDLSVPHYFRKDSYYVRSLHKAGFSLTEREITRYIVNPGRLATLKDLLPLYSVIEAKKDSRTFSSYLRRRLEYKKTEPSKTSTGEVFNEDRTKSYYRLTSK